MDLEKWLRDYEKVFLVDSCERVEALVLETLRHVNRTGRRVLFLSQEGGTDGVRQISEEEYRRLWDLYFLYECSDRFQVLADRGMYGSLLNYVDTGLLTVEEAAEALLR